jgi:hypothetical protein
MMTEQFGAWSRSEVIEAFTEPHFEFVGPHWLKLGSYLRTGPGVERKERPGDGLPEVRPQSHLAVDGPHDQLRERFGSDAITRAVLLGSNQRPSVPLLPD